MELIRRELPGSVGVSTTTPVGLFTRCRLGEPYPDHFLTFPATP